MRAAGMTPPPPHTQTTPPAVSLRARRPPGSQLSPSQTLFALGVFALAAVALALRMAAARADERGRRDAEQAYVRLASVVEASDDAIFSQGLDGTILTWNAGAERLYGYRAAEVIGRPVAMHVPPDRLDEARLVLDGLRRGNSFRYDTVRMRKDGTRCDVALTVSPLRDESGGVTGSSTVARDITERRRADLQLRQHVELLNLSYDAIGRGPRAVVGAGARAAGARGRGIPDADRG